MKYEALLKLIKAYEDFSSTHRVNEQGLYEIGYAHLDNDKTHVTPISLEKAQLCLLNDIEIIHKAILRKLPLKEIKSRPFYELEALIALVFDVGLDAVDKSKIFEYYLKEEYESLKLTWKRLVFFPSKNVLSESNRRLKEIEIFEGNL